MISSLPDILEDDLDILFVGINPGTYSAKVGHYYAHPANRFWPMLYRSGIVPTPLAPKDDWKLPRFRIGVTDLVKRTTSGSHDLSSSELKKGGEILQKKISYYRPKVVCLNGLLVYQNIFGDKEGPGLTHQKIHTSQVFSIPSTSPRNVFYSTQKLLPFFIQLNELRKTLRS